ncbi:MULTISPECIES: thioredoxin family protein [Solibacillus]|uniref:Thioredoxin family protein n=1 Tax=Solibacillus faecavium TaxID=2762221 RepID=A0ABR8XX16_9BACL|nr:thioredoxin family protein [Solibacillus faecavium]MBD8036477.1 thioredoxin family protein [Solibacillus faecavium]
MKKLAIVGAVIVLLFAGIIILTNMKNSEKLEDNPYGTKNLKQSTIDLLDDENYQNIILPDALAKKIESGEGVVGYFFSPECSHCKNYTPKLMPIADEMDIQVDQLNILEYTNEWDTYNITATPTLIYFENGEEVARLEGDAPNETTRQFFNDVVLK